VTIPFHQECGLWEGRMATVDLNDILGLIDSTKGEVICKKCLKEEELSYIPEEEAITQEKIQSGDTYVCSRCNKEL
jgi:superfamily II helicase